MANLHHGACFALLAACSGAALADDPVRASLEAQASTGQAYFASGLSGYLDPLTRRPATPPDWSRQLPLGRASPAEMRDDRKLRYETVPGVGVLMHTNGQFEMSSWARLRADGTVEADCMPGAATGAEVVEEPQP